MRNLTILLTATLVSACDAVLPGAPEAVDELAGTVPGLSGPQTAMHFAGDAEFARVFGAADGLGPIFVAASCESCHVGDGKGHPLFNITRFGRDTPGGFDPMRATGGPQLQDRAVLGYLAESVPVGATGVARFTAPIVTGLGYLEAVDDTTLLNLEDPTDANADGISGRVQLIEASDLLAEVVSLEAIATDGPPSRGMLIDGQFYIGRFGKKALSVNLLQQVVTAYHQDMGITSDLIPHEIFNPAVGPFTGDGAPEPEVPASVVNAVTFYIKTLKAPPRRNVSHPDVIAGQVLFDNGPCASCHLPQLTTGASSLAALDRVTFAPYTDLLLHDMGSELDDGYTEGRATTSEWRTAPLWGIGLSARFQGGSMHLLHDGRAKSIPEAVQFHGGEGAGSRTWFNGLTDVQRRQVIAYLMSL
ncbi:MAG: di-heme oxidoredictase family protein [Gemmatimonadaceae bacterium]